MGKKITGVDYMAFKEQLWKIIQKENPHEELMTFQKMKGEFDDVCGTLVETLTPEQKMV